LSPTALVFVQILEFDVSAMVVPAAMLPVVVALVAGAGVVFTGAGVVFAAGAVFFVVELVVFFVPDGVLVVVAFGTSVNCGLAALSALARARFAASAESFLSESVFAESPLQPASVRAAIARDATVKRVYLTIGNSSLEDENLPN
jgi:hypothetical protein